MKYLTLVTCVLIISSNVLAYDGSKLRMNIGGKVTGTHYLCVSHVGCINIAAGQSGRTFPLTPGSVNYILLAEGRNYRMYPQALPHSCNITINQNQTLVVSGRVSKAANDNMYINQLRCSVVNG